MFSVIIPLYNKADTVERAVRSVLSQTFQEFELIIVDDGSTDEGSAIVEQISDSRIRLIRQENAGVSVARNRGWVEARFQYMTFLDADDVYLPNFLTTMRRLITEYPQAQIFGCAYVVELNSGKRIIPKIRGLPRKFEGLVPDYFQLVSRSAPLLCTISVCIEKSALQAVGGFPEGIRSGEDLLTWARICFRCRLAYSSQVNAIYKFEISDFNHNPRVPEKEDYVGAQLQALYRERTDRYLKRYIALWFKMRFSIWMRLNDRREMRKAFIASLKWNPWNYRLWLLGVISLLPGKLRLIFFR